MKIKMVLLVLLILILSLAGYAMAQNSETVQSTLRWTLVDLTILLVTLLSGFFAVQLYLYVKSGELATAWRFLAGAAFLASFHKVLEIGGRFHTFRVDMGTVQVVELFVVIFIALGFYFQKRTLS